MRYSPCLRALDISFPKERDLGNPFGRYRPPTFSGTIPQDLHLKNREVVRLTGLEVNVEDLQSFLTQHQKTLRSVHIEVLDFGTHVRAVVGDQYYHVNAPYCSRALRSWLEFFRDYFALGPLVQHLRVTSVPCDFIIEEQKAILSHRGAGSWTESEVIFGKMLGKDKPCRHECLWCQINIYIIRHGRIFSSAGRFTR